MKFAVLLLFPISLTYAQDAPEINYGEVGGKKSTILRATFGSETRFNETIVRAFDKLDDNKDGVLSSAELQQKINGSVLNNDRYGRRVLAFMNGNTIQDALISVDTNKDSQISLDEFHDSLLASLNTEITLDSKYCDRVHDIMKPCAKRSFSWKPLVSTFSKKDAKEICHRCEHGVSSLEGFTTEKCIMKVALGADFVEGSVASCEAIKECVNAYFGRDAQQVKITDLQRDAYGRQVSVNLFFAGLIGATMFGVVGLGLFSWFSLFLIMEIVGLAGAFHWYSQYTAVKTQQQ